MTAFVLVLAGLTAGDGGQGMGAARESVVPRLDSEWEGEGVGVVYSPMFGWLGEDERFCVLLTRGWLLWRSGQGFLHRHPDPRFLPDGRFGTAGWTWRLDGDRLTIRGEEVSGPSICRGPYWRFTLYPVPPPKP